MKKAFLSALCLLFHCLISFSNTFIDNLSFFQEINEEHTNIVRCMAQDSYGNIWVGTMAGLLKYDGCRVVSFHREDYNLPSNFINCICPDSYGNIWFGTSSGLACYDYNSDSFIKPDIPEGTIPVGFVCSILCGSDGTIWFTDKERRILSVENGKVTEHVFDGLCNSHKRIALSPSSGDIFVCAVSCFHVFHPAKNTLESVLLEPGFAFSVNDEILSPVTNPEEDKLFYVLSVERGLCEINVDAGTIRTLYHWEDGQRPRSMSISKQRYLFVATTNGLVVYDIITGKAIRKMFNTAGYGSIPENNIAYAITDKNDFIWIGTRNYGVYSTRANRLDSKNFTQLDNGISLKGCIIRGFAEDSNNHIWIATETAGLLFLEAETSKLKKYMSDIIPTYLNTINYDGESILIGTQNGLIRLNPITGKTDCLRLSRVETIYHTTSGRTLVGSFGGLFEYKQGKLHLLLPLDEGSTIVGMAEDKNGSIWCNTYSSGIFYYSLLTDTISPARYFTGEGNGVGEMKSSIFVDSKGQIWVTGRDATLYKYETDARDFVMLDKSKIKNFPTHSLLSFCEDGYGNYWIPTSSGLFLYNPESGISRTFHKKDGLLNECFTSACLKDSSGDILLGSRDGFICICPGQTTQPVLPKNVIISDFMVGESTVHPGKDGPITVNINLARKISLKTNQNSFGFKFAMSKDATAPVYCELVGFDRTPVDISDNMEIFYYGVPPGDYLIKVTGHDDIKLSIAKPFWLSPPGIMLILLFLICILFVSIYYVYRHEEQKKKEVLLRMERSKNAELLKNIETVVLRHLDDEKFDVETFATELFLSKSSLQRKMKTLLGTTPVEYIQRLRLNKAAEYLKQGDYSISEVSEMVGFSYQSYFSKCFKDAFGVTPAEFIPGKNTDRTARKQRIKSR